MQTHRKLLSIFHIVNASIGLFILLVGYTFYESFMPFIVEEVQHDEDAMMVFGTLFPLVRMFILVFVLATALPAVIGGIAYLKGQRWGLTLLLIVGCLGLFSFPIGTALGIYTIWVFVQEQKESND